MTGQEYSVHPLELKVPPIIVFLVFLTTYWCIAVFFPVFDVNIPFRMFISFGLSGLSIATGIYSFALFKKKGTTIDARHPAGTTLLITEGPYRHTRNPMYLSLSLLLIAWAVFWSDLLALMLMPAFYAYITRFQIIPEERILASKFGEHYTAWADRTPRWL